MNIYYTVPGILIFVLNNTESQQYEHKYEQLTFI